LSLYFVSATYSQKQCTTLKPPKNGVVAMKGLIPGDTAKVNCNKGYLLRGPAYLTCKDDGQWSSTDYTCKCRSQFLLFFTSHLIIMACKQRCLCGVILPI